MTISLGVPEQVRELLVCPQCRQGLRDGPDAASLDCLACGLRYPIRDGIPVMLIEQATPLVR